MIAPTTLAVAATFSAEKTYGSEAGNFSFQSVAQRDAAYERISSSARGSRASRPRSVLIVTGKKVRYAAITATGIQTGSPLPPSQITTIGAIARIGIVCDATTYGRRPRRRRRKWWRTVPIARPMAACP